ncbi:AbfB domain-containing protein [Actinoplanes sp. TFC3]|uniref:AbfB domain-containing protein n=1 Tax=Actinoplanes sp. TFC3 TaxID=1710355 RepID=UPI00082DD937|nr:AbfB domain-containing protein [Actinoplanes sp. TFC3]
MTLYGRGGVDAKEPRQGLFTRLHPAVTAGVSVAIIAVLALAYWIWRATTGTTKPVAAATASASPSPSPATPSKAAPTRLAPGSWLIFPRDATDTFLTSKQGFAALTKNEPVALNVVKGLADDKCFSVRTDDGRYLRHFNYRLRFDATEDADLFRNDATFCPEDGTPAGAVRLRSKNYPDHVIHRRGTELYIDEPGDSATFTADSTFGIKSAEGS